jgi:hypothetical protein
MQKMQAIGAPFTIEHSSCSDLKPKQFDWTIEDHPVKVFIDGGIPFGMNYRKKPGERKIAWVCESRAIFHSMSFPREVWESSLGEISNSYDLVFTSEKSIVGKYPNIKYCPAGSNLPWIKEQEVYTKTKMTSLIASPKKFAFGHSIRHLFAERWKDKLDLYGGVLGSKRVGKSTWDKLEALQDYRFSIVIENDKYETYYTEKITDCFATGTIPVYWGAPDIDSIFNPDGIITLTSDFDIDSLTPELYESKLEAVKDNFNRVKDLESADSQLFGLIREN